MRRLSKMAGLFALVALSLATAALVGAGSAAAVGNTLQVPSQYATIQDAVNAANPTGATIIVQPGTYTESVWVYKNNITIKGAPNKANPVLASPGDNSGCGQFEPQDGICVFKFFGTIKNVEISNLTIQGFAGSGITAFAADGLNFHDNTVTNNADYGISAFGSSHIQVVNNTASDGGEAGIYIGDSPNANLLVRGNTLTNNRYGIFLRDSSHGTVTENFATGNCFGILLIDTIFNPDPVFDWTLVHNTANANDKACPGLSIEKPPVSGGGIVVVGAAHARLTANTAKDNVSSDATLGSGGIIVISAVCFGGANPTYVQVDHNVLSGNSPADLEYDGTGHHNTFFANGVSVTLIPPLC